MSGAISPLLNTLSRRGAQFKKHGGNFTFTFTSVTKISFGEQLMLRVKQNIVPVSNFILSPKGFSSIKGHILIVE
jgi:hypothetical protein